MWNRLNDEPSMMKSVTEKSAEKQIATTDGSEQYSLEQVRGVTNVTAGTNTLHEESLVQYEMSLNVRRVSNMK